MTAARQTRPPANAVQRKLGQMIHIAKAQLGLDEDGYRQMLRVHGGEDSTTKMSVVQLEKVLAHLKSAGFKAQAAKPKRGRRPHNLGAGDRGPLMKKIEALLTDAGLPWGYAAAMAKRMYRKERLEFCDGDDLAGIVAALEKAAIKRLVPALRQALADAGLMWAHGQYIAIQEFGFDASDRNLDRYPQAMSQVLRWLRGELAGKGVLKRPGTETGNG